MHLLLVLNPSAGSQEADAIAERAQRDLGDVRIVRLDEGVDLGAEVSRALEEDRAVIAAGGDGTVNAVVQHLVGTSTSTEIAARSPSTGRWEIPSPPSAWRSSRAPFG